ncbi:MAG TPA: quinolinate synthase NadA [Actinomycetes bacterium]|nr:quinolinate synthase NadA [Actinomycetes bacterium]
MTSPAGLDLPEGVEPTPLALLLLGRGEPDLRTERGVECPGDLPSPSDPDLVARAQRAKERLGDQVFVLGHHYQRDEVIAFADVTGDSFKLAQQAAARPESPYIVFCGVHFMAESADILTAGHQQVVLPDLAAGCSMADMAALTQVEDCWDGLVQAGVADAVVPVSYMNSSADIKAFTGRHGGTICTSSNAKVSLEWAFAKGEKVLFLPDQHLGRNTAVREMGMSLDDCVLWDPHKPGGGLTPGQLRDARMILWRGHCSVHGRFSIDSVDDVRARIPDVQVLVHPECKHEVVAAADHVGSTEVIIQTLAAAPAGSAWAVGTELNLVKRLAAQHPDKKILFLDRTVCFCSTMNRIDLPHLVWALESLVEGRVVNRIEVDPDTAHWARVALDQMLALPSAKAAKD